MTEEQRLRGQLAAAISINKHLVDEVERLKVELAAQERRLLFSFQETNNMALEEIKRLRVEVDEWKERWAAERRDHEATIKQCDRYMSE